MHKRFHYAIAIVIMAFLIAGCFGMDPGPIVDPGNGNTNKGDPVNGNGGSGDDDEGAGNGDNGSGDDDEGAGNGDNGSGDDDEGAGNGDGGSGDDDEGVDNEDAFNDLLDDFEIYSEAKAWDELAKLYHYPLTFVLVAPGYHCGGSRGTLEDAVREQYEAGLPEHVTLVSLEISNIHESECPAREEGKWDVAYSFNGKTGLKIEFAMAAEELLPELLFIHGLLESEDYSHTYEVKLEDRVTPVDGDPNTMSAMMEFTKMVEDDPKTVWDTIITPSVNTFTFVLDDSEWKIQRHVHVFLEPEYIGTEPEM